MLGVLGDDALDILDDLLVHLARKRRLNACTPGLERAAALTGDRLTAYHVASGLLGWVDRAVAAANLVVETLNLPVEVSQASFGLWPRSRTRNKGNLCRGCSFRTP